MNWDTVEGTWKQLRGRVRQKWGELTEDDVDIIDGQRDVLCGKLQERHGIAKDMAEREVRELERDLDRGIEPDPAHDG